MLALILVLGLFPNIIFSTTDPAVVESLDSCLSVDEDDPAAAACGDVYDLDTVAAGEAEG